MNQNEELIQKRKFTEEKELKSYRSMIYHPDYNLHQTFSRKYFQLLQAIQKNDLASIGKLTEKNLYREFNAGI